MHRPDATEHAPYFSRYIDLVSGHDALQALQQQSQAFRRLISEFSEADSDYRYAPGKWSVKEVVGHVTDAERIFVYRALRFARMDATDLPSFDENSYVEHANFGRRSLGSVADEFAVVRRASELFFGSLDEASWDRRGKASNNMISVRALAWLVAGHATHHEKLLESKYLAAVTR